MRHFVWACIAVVVIAGGTGCHSMRNFLVNGNKGCSDCGGQGCTTCGKGHGHGHGHGRQAFAGGVPNHDPNYYGGQGGCQHCGTAGAGAGVAAAGYAAGPGQVTYPYYTTRGPRDFLVDDPPSLGP